MKIDFDLKKHQANVDNPSRRLGFDRAADFDFASAVVREDTRKSYPESRFVALGFLDARLHVLCFTPIREGIRVISFRKANKREMNDYEQAFTADR